VTGRGHAHDEVARGFLDERAGVDDGVAGAPEVDALRPAVRERVAGEVLVLEDGLDSAIGW
jgi:hypothetical protein